MKITLKLMGLLNEHIGEESVFLEFSPGATFGDLLKKFHNQYGELIPDGLWDTSKCQFRPGILCVGEGRDMETKETPLKDGETIYLVAHIAGG